MNRSMKSMTMENMNTGIFNHPALGFNQQPCRIISPQLGLKVRARRSGPDAFLRLLLSRTRGYVLIQPLAVSHRIGYSLIMCFN